jgi:Flp pilus assembly protein TadD
LVVGSALAVVALGIVFRSPRRSTSYLPIDDGVVLADVPPNTDPRERELAALRARLARDPKNVDLACEVARRCVEQSRARSDPRYLGRAQSALDPWWAEREPPPDVLLLRATIRQSQHEFDLALVDLDALVRVRPRDPQAWLTRATVLTVLGRYAEASTSCAPLHDLASPVVNAVCTGSIDSLIGDAHGAYSRLALARASGATEAESTWALSVQGEVAIRMGDDQAAYRDLSQALTADPADVYTRTLLADLLLDLGRPAEARDLVATHENDDAQLLRLVLANKRLGAPEASSQASTLRGRYEASRARGDVVHRREQARFYGEVDGNAPLALSLAKENWTVQREPADARVLLDCALLAGDPSSAAPVVKFLQDSHAEEPRLAALARKAAR